MDLGSGSPLNNFALINLFNPAKYAAVDFDSLEHKMKFTLQELIKQNFDYDTDRISDELYSVANNNFNYYQYYINKIFKREVKHSEVTFNETFEFTKSDLFEFARKSETKYDLIIISKVLSHLLPSSDENDIALMGNIKELLTENGRIFLRLNGEGYRIKSENIPNENGLSFIRKTYSHKSVFELASNLTIENGPDKHTIEKYVSPTEKSQINEYTVIMKYAI